MRTVSIPGDLRDKRVFVRSNFNVPLKDGVITDGGRARMALPTLKTLIDAGAKVVIVTHLDRPKGQVDPAFSLAPVATHLAKLSGVKVTLASGVVGPSTTETVAALSEGEIVLFENVRYDARKTSKVDEKREEPAHEYTRLGGAFVSDGFDVVHRKQAFVYGIVKTLPLATDLLVLKETESLSKVTGDPECPYGVVPGDSKVSDKLSVIANLLKKTSIFFIGGGMAFTFLAAQGHSVSKSLLKKDQIETIEGYIAEAAKRSVDLVLPINVVVAPEFAADASATVVKVDATPDDQASLDIGLESAELFTDKLVTAETVAWNGLMGVFEFDAFVGDTRTVAEVLSISSISSVVDGGDSAATVRLLDFDEDTFSHISTDSGASLEFLEGRVLPGIAVLGD